MRPSVNGTEKNKIDWMSENYTEIHLTLPSRFAYNRPFNWLIKGVGCFEKDDYHLLIIKQSLINSHWDAHYSPQSALSVLPLMFLGSNQTLMQNISLFLLTSASSQQAAPLDRVLQHL